MKKALSTIITRFAMWGGAAVFRKYQLPRLHPPVPDWPGCRALEATSRDGCRIRGWWQPESKKKGTLVFVHGITIHSFHYVEQAQYLSRETGLAVAALDLRFHGMSDDAAFTFGAAESWDVRAFLDALDAAGACRPYILIGDSLGGLATQRAIVEDARIDGAALMQTPGWSWNAVLRAARRASPLARFLNSYFGYDILGDGDVRNVASATLHRPPIFYAVGDADLYDWKATKEIYDWWGTPNAGEISETPLSAPERSRWFVLVEGAEHDTGLPDSYNVWRWPLLWPNLIRFVEIVCARTG
ncbi:MAG TPA: alpha/beta fold hydrolase [Chthoniobacterales bacterium]